MLLLYVPVLCKAVWCHIITSLILQLWQKYLWNCNPKFQPYQDTTAPMKVSTYSFFCMWGIGEWMTLLMPNCFRDHETQKGLFTFWIVSWIWLDLSRRNLLCNNNTCCLSYTAKTIPANALAPLGDSASAGMVLNPKARIFQFLLQHQKSENYPSIGKTPVRIILWCPITKMLIKACFLIQPLEQEGGCQKCCMSLCSKVFINHFYQMKASPGCLNILTYWRKYWIDRLRRTLRRKV